MPVDRFIDTNILLYAYDLDAPAKRDVAQSIVQAAWLKPGSAAISVQVLQEFHVNFLRAGHPREEAIELIGDFCIWPVVEDTLSLFNLGLAFQEKWKISLWDSMILAAARSISAKELVTEDLNHGQDYGGVRAVNPFL